MSDARRASAVLTVDVNAIVDNWRRLDRMVGETDCAAVVKADAYGLGVAHIAPALRAAGCLSFFTASVDEALALRVPLPAADIYELGGVPPGAETDIVAAGVIPVLNHLGEIEIMAETARRLGVNPPVAIHIDTGMNRLGLGPDELETLLDEPSRLDGLYVRSWITHLARADEDDEMNLRQLCRFAAGLAYLPDAPTSIAASSGIFLGDDFHRDMVRPGAALYGINPTPALPNPMRPAVRLDARVLQLRAVERGETVGYGATHAVRSRARIATLGLGYADGYHRSLASAGHVWFGEVAAPIVGRISMDLITVDATDVPEPLCEPGCFAEVIGPHRPVDTVAREAGTIGYEILTSLGPRHHRVHITGAAS